MHPSIRDIEFLLVASRDVLSSEEFDAERLQAWSAKRNAIFCRLKERDPVIASADMAAMAALLRELLDLDAKIRVRINENQLTLGEQIAAARNIRRGFRQGTSRAPQLLQRLA